eukprot:g5739.t1
MQIPHWMAKETRPQLRFSFPPLYRQRGTAVEESRHVSNSAERLEPELAFVTEDASPERLSFRNGTELISKTERRDLFRAAIVSGDNQREGRTRSSQSTSVRSDLALESLIQRRQSTVRLSRGFGSQSVDFSKHDVESSDTLTFPQSVEKVWVNFSDKKRLSTVQSITSLLHIPSSDVSMGEPRTINTEITEVTSNNEQETTTPMESEVSITSRVPVSAAAAVAKPELKVPKSVEPSRKKRRFWRSLRYRRRCFVCFPKPLCRCFSFHSRETMESIHQYPIYEISRLDLEDGIIKSKVTLDSSTTRKIEEVIDENGGLIILTGSKLDTYQNRLDSMMSSVFDRAAGYSLLDTWRSEKPEQTLELLESAQELTSSFENRVLTLADIDLTQIKRTTRTDDRENAFARYFSSFQGLNPQMLVP